MTTIFLVRHAAHELPGGILAGRTPGVHLNPDGRRQAENLAARLAHEPIAAVYSSPLERARETAAPIAGRFGLEVRISDGLHEIDFGDWTKQSFHELAREERWRLFNSFRSGSRAPNGELMLEAQARIVATMGRLREEYPKGGVVLVSHGDVIKAALAYWLGSPIDLFWRIEIRQASLSIVRLDHVGPRILRINECPVEYPEAYPGEQA